MPGNLTALVQQLQALGTAPAPAGPFAEALRVFWAGKFADAEAKASALLADDPNSADRFAAYRLWIEALAERRDRKGLRALRDHLFLRGQVEPDDHQTYAALRGIAHLELDEIGAARLLGRSMADCTGDPYCLEVRERVEARGERRADDVPELLRSTAPLADYFHWQTLARSLLVAKDEEALNEALGFVRSHFRGSVLPHVFEYHRCIESGFYAGAALVAQRLSELYPDNVDYRYYHAYALYEDGDYPAARRILNETLRLTGDDDPEVVSLLGHCNAKLGDPEKAAGYLRRAVALLAKDGMPSSHVTLELANVEDELRGDSPDAAVELPRVTRNWLVPLSPRRYHELVTSSESAVDRLLRPMGQEPRPGDYCFFALITPPDASGRSLWRIVAIYAVDSEPLWHPTYRWHSALKLVKRLPEGIPVDVQSDDDETAVNGVGLYELDMGALSIIEEAARLHREDMIERRRDGGQSRRPTA